MEPLYLPDYFRSIFFALIIFFSPSGSSVELPLRTEFKEVPTINLGELYAQRANVVVVDVRSEYEYGILHIKGAKNIPIATLGFIPQVKALRSKTEKTIIFYCNGITCKKSYKATEAAFQNSIPNVKAFDEGILA